MANDEKAQLYKQIVQGTPEWTLLERMQTLGFWPPNEPIPQDPPEEAKERAKIEAEIAQLRGQATVVADPEKALQEERIRRWQESKQRRSANKVEREAKQLQRRKEWEAEKARTVVHAGPGVSAGLQETGSQAETLAAQDLPVVHDARQLAKAMGMKLSRLRWLTFHRKGAALVHYHRYQIPKKTGGTRAISAPKPKLAAAQRWVLDQILSKLSIEPEAHGFVTGRSIVSAAAPHAGKAVVINLDLQDFFPSITFRRVKGLFQKLGYAEQVATVLALLCTEPPRVPVQLDGKRYHIALGERQLPQGACTSPAITNTICRRLDRRLAGLSDRLGFTYTRYADDLTFSGDDPKLTGKLLDYVRKVIAEEGFTEHPAKTRVMRRSRRQEVTGLTVNERPAMSRVERRRLRAILHNAAVKGPKSQNRDDRPDFAAHLRGRVAFAAMVEPDKAEQWWAALDRALSA